MVWRKLKRSLLGLSERYAEAVKARDCKVRFFCIGSQFQRVSCYFKALEHHYLFPARYSYFIFASYFFQSSFLENRMLVFFPLGLLPEELPVY